MPPLKRKELSLGEISTTTASKRHHGTVKHSEGLAAKQISPASAVSGSSEDPLAYPSSSQRSSAVPKSLVATSPDIFPRFSAGTVTIHLSQELNSEYRLHRAVLDRNSVWFAIKLKKPEGTRDSFGFRFTLTQPSGQVIFIPLLVQTKPSPEIARSVTAESVGSTCSPTHSAVPRPPSHTQRVPVDRRSSTTTVIGLTSLDRVQSKVLTETRAGANEDLGSKPEVAIKQEPQHNSAVLHNASEAQQPNQEVPGGTSNTDASAKQQRMHQQYIEAYDGLFSMFYNIAPRISASDVDCALKQCEKIVNLARFYGSLPTVRPYLGNALAEFHGELYASIAHDPPRWLRLGVALESGSIFSEALTHCAGSYPSCPWKTQFSALPSNVITIIEDKSLWLARLRSQVNEELLINTLEESDGHPVSITTSPEAWIVVQIFHDWVGKQINRQRDTGTLQYGEMYRKMAQGGDAYLPTSEVTRLIDGTNLQGELMDEWESVEGDLDKLKLFAKRVVGQLIANHVLIDPVALGIPYLTCVKVGKEEYPWTKKGDAKPVERAG